MVIEDGLGEASVITTGDNMGSGLLCGRGGVGNGAAETATRQHGGIVVAVADGKYVVECATDDMR